MISWMNVLLFAALASPSAPPRCPTLCKPIGGVCRVTSEVTFYKGRCKYRMNEKLIVESNITCGLPAYDAVFSCGISLEFENGIIVRPGARVMAGHVELRS